MSDTSLRRLGEHGRRGRRGRVPVVIAIVVSLCSAAMAARAASLSDRAALDAFIEAGRVSNGFKTTGVLLCDGHGSFYTISLGGDEESSGHLLASATKLASATAVMSVVDDGLLSLDDPIGKYLPQFGPNRRGITIRQLLSQTHGLPGNHAAIALPQVDNGLSLAQAVDRIASEDTLVFPPGSKHTYMPAVSYHIVGRIAEIVTGKTWARLFEERVGVPLEMTGFSYGDTPNPRIGGGAKCALRDYGNLVQMHLAGGVFKGRRVLSAASVAEMQKDQLRGVPFTPARAVPSTVGYGLTWWFNRLDDTGQPRLLSVPGAWGATPWIDRKLGYGGFLLVEEPMGTLGRVADFFLELADEVARLLVPETSSGAVGVDPGTTGAGQSGEEGLR
jgi:CubicO group peptidase (beta-lactamase class C family)